jgi:hypothetical protein
VTDKVAMAIRPDRFGYTARQLARVTAGKAFMVINVFDEVVLDFGMFYFEIFHPNAIWITPQNVFYDPDSHTYYDSVGNPLTWEELVALDLAV